jgi:hypothetical protein
VDDEGPIGPFSTWAGLYLAVILYGIGMILLLLFLTRVLEPGAS